MLGWYILVINLTFGADIGYSSGRKSSNLKTPFSYGDWNMNNTHMTYLVHGKHVQEKRLIINVKLYKDTCLEVKYGKF